MVQIPNSSVLALDIGAKRVGVAIAHASVGFASPLTTLEHDQTIAARLTDLCHEHDISAIVCGLPRGLNGQETAQTAYARTFAASLPALLNIPVYLVDEALTSSKAEAELLARGKPYQKGDVDALAATYILEDYLASGPSETVESLHDSNKHEKL